MPSAKIAQNRHSSGGVGSGYKIKVSKVDCFDSDLLRYIIPRLTSNPYQNPQAGCTCENGGECALVGDGGGGAGKRLECRCKEGFAGERCERCEGSPPGLCQNGGVCTKDALGQPMCRFVKKQIHSGAVYLSVLVVRACQDSTGTYDTSHLSVHDIQNLATDRQLHPVFERWSNRILPL